MVVRDLTERDVLGLADGEPQWLQDRRLEAYKAFADLAWPTKRDEEWRFTDPRRFRFEELDLVHADEALKESALVERHLGTVVQAVDKLSALALAAFTRLQVVHVAADERPAERIVVRVHADREGVHIERVLVVLDHHAEATIVVEQTGVADSTSVTAVEVVLGDGAQGTVVTRQALAEGAHHVALHNARVGRDARYRHFEATVSGSTVYVQPDVWLAEPGGSAELLGLYIGRGESKIEHRSLIFHDASHTSSDYVHKGALADSSHATWYGNIRIAPHAKDTSSDETNRNLILGEHARADTLPFLEILTADVAACGHHSSVGQLDEQQLFYLTSRGIDRATARRMLVVAFYREVLDRFGEEWLRDELMAEIEEIA